MRLLISLMLLMLLAACAPGHAQTSLDELPPGDAGRGAALFTETINGAPSCASCHTLDDSTVVGPGLQDYAAIAATRVEGVSAEEYTHASIVRPAAHVVSGFGNLMYNQYAQRLSPQQIADLIAYLLTL